MKYGRFGRVIKQEYLRKQFKYGQFGSVMKQEAFNLKTDFFLNFCQYNNANIFQQCCAKFVI